MENWIDKNGTIFASEGDIKNQYGSGAYYFLNRGRNGEIGPCGISRNPFMASSNAGVIAGLHNYCSSPSECCEKCPANPKNK